MTSPGTQSKRGATRRRKRPSRPEAGSLQDIMRRHSDLSLYVLPICWTDVHATLLGIRFLEKEPIRKPVPGPRHDQLSGILPSQTARILSRELTMLLSEQSARPFVKTQAIKNIMSVLFPATLDRPTSVGELDLYFGDRVFSKAVRLPALWRPATSLCTSFDSVTTRPATSFLRPADPAPDTPSTGAVPPPPRGAPLLAYVNRSHLRSVRENLYRVCPGPESGDRANMPVLRLQQLRSRQLRPANDDHDAHYAAILLAMAQARFYGAHAPDPLSQPSPAQRPGLGGGARMDAVPERFDDVQVRLLTHDDHTADFLVYTAVVSAAFLERFAHPAQAPRRRRHDATDDDEDGDAAAVETGLPISLVRVPIWPVLGLKERLGRALGREIAGDAIVDRDYDDSDADEEELMETWETEEDRQRRRERTRRLEPRKRKRPGGDGSGGSLIDIFQSSFETDDDAASCAGSDDGALLSPGVKRRCTRTANPLEVC